MASLAEQLAQLNNPTPVFHDPLEDSDEESQAKLVEKSVDDDVSEDRPEISQLRRKSASLLADTDQRYVGKKTSRKQLQRNSDEESPDEWDEDGHSDSDEERDNDRHHDDASAISEDENSEDDNDAFKEKFRSTISDRTLNTSEDDEEEEYMNDDEEVDGHDDEDDLDEDEEESADEHADEESDVEEDDQLEDKDEVKKFSSNTLADEVEKGKATRCQLGLWDSLLEMRIKLQKVLALTNQLPQKSAWSLFSSTSEEFSQSSKEARSSLKNLLDQLVALQSALLLQNSETKHVVTGTDQKKEQKDPDDEEITSDSEVETEADQENHSQLKRKLKTADYPEFLAKRHKEFSGYRNTTIQKWYDKTRVASGKLKSKSFNVFDQSALKQIEQVLGDRDRLIKRTQVKRSAYRVLGMEEAVVEKVMPKEDSEEGVVPSRNHLKEYDSEIFDDDDFYHQLLRELIERKSADTNDPVALSRQWLEIQKLRNKVKRKVDTKASKGRKIRYDIHPKLVNFMAPIDTCSWQDEARDDLYSSLFGQRHKTQGMQ